MHAQKGISIMYKCDRMERNKKEVKCGLTCDCFNVDLVSEKIYILFLTIEVLSPLIKKKKNLNQVRLKYWRKQDRSISSEMLLRCTV